MPHTERRQQVLDAIISFWNERGYSPTIRELANICGLESSSSMHAQLGKLQRDGKITFLPNSPRTIVVINDQQGEVA